MELQQQQFQATAVDGDDDGIDYNQKRKPRRETPGRQDWRDGGRLHGDHLLLSMRDDKSFNPRSFSLAHWFVQEGVEEEASQIVKEEEEDEFNGGEGESVEREFFWVLYR